LTVVLIAAALASLFVASYTIALGQPVPRHVPVGLVGDPRGATTLVGAVEAAAHDAIEFRPYPTAEAAEAAVDRQILGGVLVLGRQPELLVSSAASPSVARALEQAAGQASRVTGTPVEVVDLHPLPPSDPLGLVPFYVTLGATLLGFITMFQLRANAPALSLRAWLAVTALLAILGGLLISIVADHLTGALHGPFLELWAALAAQIAVTALFCSTMLVLLRPWAMIPTFVLFIAVGNPSSGGAVSAPLLPPAYAVIGRFLPSGATVSIIHNAVYFRHVQHVGPFIVEGAWLVGCLAALLISVRVLRRTPTDD
jgi:hypothetical protein